MAVCTNLTLFGTTVFDEYSHVAGEKALDWPLQFYLEVRRLSADNRYRPIIGQFHIDDNEITNDSVISHVSSSTFNRTK